MDHAARIDVLVRENEMLRARLADIERLLVGTVEVPIELQMTPAEARVLSHIASRQVATKQSLMAALYLDLGRDVADPKITDVFVCKIRKKLRGWPIEITTIWGQGWAMNADGKAWLQSRRKAAA